MLNDIKFPLSIIKYKFNKFKKKKIKIHLKKDEIILYKKLQKKDFAK